MTLVALVLVVGAIAAWQVVHRSSALVRRWHCSSFQRRAAGPLSVLDSGSTDRDDEEVVVLLHGLGATGDYFGAFYDGLSRRRRVIIVDLLGFGHSIDEEQQYFEVRDHVEALDEALRHLGLDESTVIMAAHSTSSAVALSWGNANSARVRRVFLWGPPVYREGSAARAAARNLGPMARLSINEAGWSQRLYRFSCDHREFSAQVLALLAPRWPTELCSDGVRNTCESFDSSMGSLLLDVEWARLLPASVPLTIFHGADDPIGDRAAIAELCVDANIVSVADADHHVALQQPQLLFDAIEQP